MARTRETFFATCQPGLEPVLHDEIRALRVARVERQTGGVYFEGQPADAWRANLWLRTAIRVLWRIARYPATNADELYLGAHEVDWTRWLDTERSSAGASLRIEAHGRAERLDNTMFVAQRVKDAIVDHFRERGLPRPDVDREQPDLIVHAHLANGRCTLSVDTSGESLHKRGWRLYQGRAPLSETLAAGIVQLAGWTQLPGLAPLVDPFCGSGTLLIEGALIASNVAPGLFRLPGSGRDDALGFAFQHLPGHDAREFDALVEQTRASATGIGKLPFCGMDESAEAIAGAAENAAAAGLEGVLQLEVGDAREIDWRRGWNAQIVSNLPYGERIGDVDNLEPMLREFGERIRAECGGYRVAFLSGSRRLTRALQLKADRMVGLSNGALSCELLITGIGNPPGGNKSV